jgi:hypothetical protein
MNITHSIESYEDDGHLYQHVKLMFKGCGILTLELNDTTKNFWNDMLNQKNHKNEMTRDSVVVENGLVTFFFQSDAGDLNIGDISATTTFSIDFNTFKDTIVEIYNELQ